MAENITDICSSVERFAANSPDKLFHILLHDGHRTELSFGNFWRRSGDFAAAFQNRGIETGEIVVISMPMGVDLLAAFLGAMRIGIIPSIMPYPNPKQKSELFWVSHETLFERIGPACFVLSASIADLYDAHLPALSDRLLRTTEVGAAQPQPFKIDPDAVAFLQHSSGTTSLKKGVKLTHRCVVDHVRSYAESCGIGPDSRLFSWLPLYHDMGLIACFIMPMIVGTTVTAMDNFEWVARPTSMLQAIQDGALEYAWMPNFGFAHLVRSCNRPRDFDLSSLKALINCSEPCRPETHDAFIERFAGAGVKPETVQVCYAMAENVFAVTQTEISIPAPAIIISQGAFDDGRAEPAEPGPNTMRIASCGRTLPYTEVGIADASRASLGEGLVGEVTIRSPHLFIGYNGRDDLTERALDNGTYYTGDLGFILGGELYLTGRKDDLILAYGRNLLAHELEALVNSVVGVKPGRVTVFDVFSETAGSNVLIVMAEMLTDTDPKEVSRAIRVTLDAAAAVSPQSIVLLNQGELLKTTSGKISRSGNRAAYMESQKKA